VIAMPKLLTKKGQDATDENYFIGGTVERLRYTFIHYYPGQPYCCTIILRLSANRQVVIPIATVFSRKRFA